MDNNPVKKLEDILNFALKINTNELFIWLINIYKSQTNNKSLLSTYDLMISKLQQKYIEEFNDPINIAEQNWGIGSRELFDIDVFQLHEMYYFDTLIKIKLIFLNEICILSTDKEFQCKLQNILDNIETSLTVSRISREKSSFHHDSGAYRKWKYDRWKTHEFLKYNLDNLSKLIDEFSK